MNVQFSFFSVVPVGPTYEPLLYNMDVGETWCQSYLKTHLWSQIVLSSGPIFSIRTYWDYISLYLCMRYFNLKIQSHSLSGFGFILKVSYCHHLDKTALYF